MPLARGLGRGLAFWRPVLTGAPPDPLAGIAFALRLQTHNGDNVPLGLWQDVSKTVPALLDGDPIAVWEDVLSASGREFTQADPSKQPLLFFESGVPTILLDGVNDYFDTADFSALTSGAEMLTALKNGNPAGPNPVFQMTGGADDPNSYLDYNGGPNTYDAFFSTLRKTTDTGSAIGADWYCYGVLSQAGLWQNRVDGVLTHDTSSNVVSAPAGGLFGSNGGGIWSGQISSIFIFPPDAGSRTLVLTAAQTLQP